MESGEHPRPSKYRFPVAGKRNKACKETQTLNNQGWHLLTKMNNVEEKAKMAKVFSNKECNFFVSQR